MLNLFFILGSFLSPHPPFDPPERYLQQFPYEEVDDFNLDDTSLPMDVTTRQRMWKLRRAYKAMIRLVDDQIGRIFQALEDKGVLQETLIIFVSDHGEMLGDHGYIQKAIHWREAVEVPCAIRHPDHLNAGRFQHPIELTDLTATLLAAAGLDPQEALSEPWPGFRNIIPGKSLLPALAGNHDPVREFAFCEFNNVWSLVHSSDFIYVRYHDLRPQGRELLFHYRDDPGENHNLALDPDYSHILATHRDYLFTILESHPPVQTTWAESYLNP
ncbi:MAG: sulfatase-like hydrolase/transferase [Verrucomicrobia bacterium]|nr:sulfatase-like hydrolase/transferase [Verrucomicrobiota bacterium]